MNVTSTSNTIVSSTLQKSILLSGKTIRELAQDAKVSSRAVGEAINGLPKETFSSSRKQKGVIRSFTKLAEYLGVAIETVLSEIGFDSTSKEVKSEIENTKFAYDDDHTLSMIDGRDPPFPNAGIADVAPISSSRGERLSFGELLMKSLLGAIDPEWCNAAIQKCSFSDAHDSLLENTNESLDIVFGLYNLNWRKKEGLTVIPVPGLKVKLKAIQISKQDLLPNELVSWFELISKKGDLPKVRFIKDEVGGFFFSGSVCYPSDLLADPITNESYTINNLPLSTKTLIDELNSNFGELGSYESSKIDSVVFVGDSEIIKHLQLEVPQRTNFQVTLLDDEPWTPTFEIGFGIRSDSEELIRIVREVVEHELFGNLLPGTASMLFDLYVHSDTSNCLEIDFTKVDKFSVNKKQRIYEALKMVNSLNKGGSKKKIGALIGHSDEEISHHAEKNFESRDE